MQPEETCPFLHDYLEDRPQLGQGAQGSRGSRQLRETGGGGGGDTFRASDRKMREIIVKNHPDEPTNRDTKYTDWNCERVRL